MDIINCGVCGKNQTKGLKVFGEYICADCEKNISQIDTNDVLDYEFYKLSIKRMYMNYIMETV